MNLCEPSQPGRWKAFAALLSTTWKEYQQDYARYFAGAMVYYALVSLVPLLLLMLSALGLLLRLSDFAVETQYRVLNAVEGSVGQQLRLSLEELLRRLEQGSVIATIISLVGLMYTGSVLFRHLRMTFRAIWKQAPILVAGSVRGAVQATFFERVFAFVMVIGSATLLLAAFVLIGIFHWLIARFDAVPLLGNTMSWLLSLSTPVLIAPITFALLFAVLPPVRLRWRHVGLATLLSAVAWIVGTEILALYVVHFGGKFSAYGAIGGLLIFMLWIHSMSQVLFFGGELCKVIYRREHAS